MYPGTSIRARFRAAIRGTRSEFRLAYQMPEHGSGIAAVRRIAAAAHDGSPAAQTRLGLCYLHGEGVPANLAEARHWLERAAEAGDAKAQTELAALALNGVAGPYERGPFAVSRPDLSADTDHRIAADLARRAANSGSAEGKALLAFILRLSPDLAETTNEADALYQESADAGWPLGKLGHAITLLQRGVPGTMREAHDLLTAAAGSGLPTAHYLLGAIAEAGIGVTSDLARAAMHYREAAEHGHTGAKCRLGLALLAGRGTDRNLTEAETWLRRAGNDGDVVAAAVLGDFHASADRNPANLDEAVHWYRRAAELGHPGSAHVLARVIAAGGEGKPDSREIADWLKKAIERGDDAAWPDLGSLIASASLPADQLPGLHGWLQRMIREDHPHAGYWVGICVNCGIGTPADAVLARRYYLWAAGEGVLEGMVAAAEMLWNGRGGPADPELARALFQYAERRGHAGSSYALGVIAGIDRERALVHFRRAAALGHAKARDLVEG
jgi:TPR repeat protein